MTSRREQSLVKVAVLADVGRAHDHVGDEAIGLATERALAARGVEVVTLARDVVRARVLRPDGQLAQGFAAPSDHAERMLLIRDLREGARTRRGRRAWARDDVRVFAETLAGCTGLHIAGGGSLNSQYGDLLTERVIAGVIARGLGLRTTLSGQTIGPIVVRRDAAAVRELIDATGIAGVRDGTSRAWAREHGIRRPVRVGLDDASFLDEDPPLGHDHDAWISGTFSPDLATALGPGWAELVASWLTAIAAARDLPVALEPHLAHPGHLDVDLEVHARIAELMPADLVILREIADPVTTSERMRQAALVVTTRFHPVVFGLAHATPVLAFATNPYSRTRIDGGLEQWGAGPALPASLLRRGDALETGLGALRAAEQTRERLRQERPPLRTASTAWWDALAGHHRGDVVAHDEGSLSQPPDAVRSANSREFTDARHDVEREVARSFRRRLHRRLNRPRALLRRLAGGMSRS